MMKLLLAHFTLSLLAAAIGVASQLAPASTTVRQFVIKVAASKYACLVCLSVAGSLLRFTQNVPQALLHAVASALVCITRGVQLSIFGRMSESETKVAQRVWITAV